MADAAIGPPATRRPVRLGLPSWAVLPVPFRKRRIIGAHGEPIEVRGVSDQGGASPDRTTLPKMHVHAAGFSLLNAYAASALEVGHQAEALDLGAVRLSLGPVSVQALVQGVVGDLEPSAREAGLLLLRDTHSRCDGVCCADPAQLSRVLAHLLLRALSMEAPPGHVRVMVTLTSCEARILILSRTPEATLAAHGEAARQDLVAPLRLLRAMGGALVLEPRRAGYLPLCIALPALSAARDQHAA